MRVVISVLIFLFLRQTAFAGCPGPAFSTNIGIGSGLGYPYHDGSSYTVYAFPSDSFLIGINGNQCHSIESVTISFNGQAIQVLSSLFHAKLPCTPGAYEILVAASPGTSAYWKIQFIAKPKVIDTTATVTQTTNLPPTKSLTPEFLFYPNPAHDEITLLNETDEIRTAYFYNASGHLLFKYEINDVRVKIPLTDYPPGLYFIHVATLSDKIIIKKITVL